MYLSSERSEKSHFKILKKNQLEFIWDQGYIKCLLDKSKACVQLNVDDMRHREVFPNSGCQKLGPHTKP